MGAEPVRVLAIPGGLRKRASHNERLCAAAAGIAGDRARFDYYLQDQLARLPIYSPDLDPPEEVRELSERLRRSDAVLLSIPEYIGSLPGGIKNALDWCALGGERSALRGKAAAVIGADVGEFGGDWAQADARKVLEAAGSTVVGDGVAIPAAELAFEPDGGLADREQERRLGAVINRLVACVRKVQGSGSGNPQPAARRG